MKFILFFLAVGFHYVNATELPLSNSAYQSTPKNKSQISKFIVGQWKLSTVSCLSGTSVHWVEPLETFQYKFKEDQSFLFQTFRSGHLIHSQTGSYNVQTQLLKVNTNQYCNHYYNSDSSLCTPIDEQSSSFISIQKDQLWILTKSGPIDGWCPLDDIVIIKLDRI